MTHQQEVFAEVIGERQSQDNKWGIQNHKPERWMVILGEEFGEACEAILEMNPKYRDELIQVAAVAIAAVESFDRWREQAIGEHLKETPEKSCNTCEWSKSGCTATDLTICTSNGHLAWEKKKTKEPYEEPTM